MQREAVVAVLDVRLAGHGIEVGLQGELKVVATRLHLQDVIKHRMSQYVSLTARGIIYEISIIIIINLRIVGLKNNLQD